MLRFSHVPKGEAKKSKVLPVPKGNAKNIRFISGDRAGNCQSTNYSMGGDKEKNLKNLSGEF